jgi:hypothetical protein
MSFDDTRQEEPPPLGIMPRWRDEELQDITRVQELAKTISRYIASGRKCPPEWAAEIADLAGKSRRND